MRVWDLPCEILCRYHLLGEHREIHAIWSILTENKKGYSRHPETLRWKGRLLALYNRHEEIVKEMNRRGYVHTSPLDKSLTIGQEAIQTIFIDEPKNQRKILQQKKCQCKV
jgi:hypothetical protein